MKPNECKLTLEQQSEVLEKIAFFFTLEKEYPELILSGSASLLIQGSISYRQIGDLDVVADKFFNFSNSAIKRGADSTNEMSGFNIEKDGGYFDLFINPHAVYYTIKVGDKEIKCHSDYQIIEKKLKAYHQGCVNPEKHRDDIIHYLSPKTPELSQTSELIKIDNHNLPF